MECVKLEVNLNARVEVTLTEFGAKVYNDYVNQFSRKFRDDLQAGHAYRTQLWELFQIFGPHIRLGMCEVPFEGNDIRFL